MNSPYDIMSSFLLIDPLTPLPSYIELHCLSSVSDVIFKQSCDGLKSITEYLVRVAQDKYEIELGIAEDLLLDGSSSADNTASSTRLKLLSKLKRIKHLTLLKSLQRLTALTRCMNSFHLEIHIIMYFFFQLRTIYPGFKPDLVKLLKNGELPINTNLVDTGKPAENDSLSVSRSFSESFYNLSRCVISSNGVISTVSKQRSMAVLAVGCIGRYYDGRVAKLIEDGNRTNSANWNNITPTVQSTTGKLTLKSQFISIIKFVHPFLMQTKNLGSIINMFLYYHGKCFSGNLLLSLFGMTLRRVTMDDMGGGGGGDPSSAGSGSGDTTDDNDTQQSPAAEPSSFLKRNSRPISVSLLMGLSYLYKINAQKNGILRREREDIARRANVHASANSSEGVDDSASRDNTNDTVPRRNNNNNNKSAVPPPPPPPLLEEFKNKTIHPNTCPICDQKPLINPSVSTSGHVFCYKCLVLKVRDNGGRCPLTGMACEEEQVVRVFER